MKSVLAIFVVGILLFFPGSVFTQASDSATVTVTIVFRSPAKATVSMGALEKVTSEISSGNSKNDKEPVSVAVYKVGENSNRPALIGGSGDKKEVNLEGKSPDETNNRNNSPERLVEIYYDDSL